MNNTNDPRTFYNEKTEQEAMELSERNGNLRLFGQPEPPANRIVNAEGMTLADYVRDNLADILASKNRRRW